MKACKCCGRRYKPNRGRSDLGFCHSRRPCQRAQSEWVKRNWDQLPIGSDTRTRAEDEFYRITTEQRRHYAYFFSLIRQPKPVKKRNCISCKTQLTSNKCASPENRMCEVCQRKLSKFGALAQ